MESQIGLSAILVQLKYARSTRTVLSNGWRVALPSQLKLSRVKGLPRVAAGLDSLVVLDAIGNIHPDLIRRFEVTREIVARDPNSGRARFDLAQRYFDRKEWEPAHVQLELARELLPPEDEFRYLVREYLLHAEYEIRNGP